VFECSTSWLPRGLASKNVLEHIQRQDWKIFNYCSSLHCVYIEGLTDASHLEIVA